MAAAAAAPNPKGLGMCCRKAAAVAGSLKLGRAPEVGGRGGDVTDEGVFEAEGVSRELTLKSDEGLGDVNTVVVEVEAVGVVVLGGGVFGGVVGAEAIVVDDTSSMSTGLCSWSLICSETILRPAKKSENKFSLLGITYQNCISCNPKELNFDNMY